MSMLLHYVRRAMELPPRETAARALEIVADRWSARRQRLAALIASDPLDETVLLRRLGDRRDAITRGFFRDGAVLPVTWSAGLHDVTMPRAAAAAAIAHRFDLLGSGSVHVSYTTRIEPDHVPPGAAAAALQRQAMDALLPGSADGYDPIDWHLDFRSGYRWDAGCWFADVEYGRRAAVDVKVPWELSRFQHAGALGLVYRMDSGSPEGQRAPAEFRAQVVDWIAANPAGRGVNWACAMDVGLRAVNWLIGIALMQDAPELDAPFRWLVARSLYAHASHIERNLEYHRDQTGNHYLSDIVSLLCIGAALPEFDDSSRWCLYGMQELAAELERQVLPDGADIEGSAAYHHLVAELFYLGTLVAVRLDDDRRTALAAARPGRVPHHRAPPLRTVPEQTFRLDRPEIFPGAHFAALRRMGAYAAAMTKHDGRIPQTGDNDNGRAWLLVPPPSPVGSHAADACDRRTVLAVAGRVFGDADMLELGRHYTLDAALLTAGAPLPHMRDSAARHPDAAPVHQCPSTDGRFRLHLFPCGGLAVLRSSDVYAAITFAAVPETGSGGHFHNDLLSFELQYDGLDFIVDGGSFEYTAAPAVRDAFRSTGAHSTVVVDGREQRLWPTGPGHLFGVHVDANVEIREMSADSLCLSVAYADVQHTRTCAWTGEGIVIEDTVTAPVQADWCVNLHPAVTVALDQEGGTHILTLARDGRVLTIRLRGVSTPVIGEGCFSSGYGARIPASRIRAGILGGEVMATFHFAGARVYHAPTLPE